jgi:hypothetical protein
LTTNWPIETGSSVDAAVTEAVDGDVVSEACGVWDVVWARARTARPRKATEYAASLVNADSRPERRRAEEGSRGAVIIMVIMVLRFWIQ